MPRIWGSRDLRPLFGEQKQGTERPSARAEKLAKSGSPATAASLRRALWPGARSGKTGPRCPEEWTGKRIRGTPRIPLLVKFIFPEDKLSVQVHPDDNYAREHEAAAGGVGKTEMWYAVSARPGAEVRLGLQPGVTRESFRQAIADGTAERCLRPLEVRAGDAFFVPAGTAHTIGAGMVLCEVQEHSDLTYRVFDYNRLQADGKPRPLHIRQALEVMNFGAQHGGRAEPVRIERGARLETYLAACPYFAVERWEFAEAHRRSHFAGIVSSCWWCCRASGRLEWSSQTSSYGSSEVWLMPAALGAYQFSPKSATSVLRSLCARPAGVRQNARRPTDHGSCLIPPGALVSRGKLPAHAVILAGGRGTRFWPRSRMSTPKQLLNIVGDSTMLEQTYERLAPLFGDARMWVVSNREQAAAVRKNLPQVSARNIIAEPAGRNTAAAIGLAAVHLLRRAGGDALMAVLPADHFIAEPRRYRRIVRAALEVAARPGALVVMGIPPTRPETGYGYIERGKSGTRAGGQPVFAVRRFTEKPPLARARRYLASRRYFWNAGMFFWRASTYLDNLKRHLPKMHAALLRLGETIGTARYEAALRRIYPQLENISVDYAILEPASRDPRRSPVFVLPAAVGWSDLGSWEAVYELLARSQGRRTFRRGACWRWTPTATFSGARGNLSPPWASIIWWWWKRPTRC